MGCVALYTLWQAACRHSTARVKKRPNEIGLDAPDAPSGRLEAIASVKIVHGTKIGCLNYGLPAGWETVSR